VVVVCLIEEHVLPVTPVCREIFQDSVRADAVLQAQLLPKLCSNCKVRKEREGAVVQPLVARSRDALWLPHCPTWQVMISRGMAPRSVPI
jgi:hypothetical protein